ncbi:hypothetical protein JAAARDRAFT_34626 [Jaapia argillacea MUCL 33604]|uniref:Uncharacterized protein n=1 Tax=Jaapia argillacea MUCL 33604 TaxID=933084 RepID=A0A067Q853_9AGAM|nr:hypothetical protein JAAARDRAFT_34626 [Jaapia argillacea MUCL 33604]
MDPRPILHRARPSNASSFEEDSEENGYVLPEYGRSQSFPIKARGSPSGYQPIKEDTLFSSPGPSQVQFATYPSEDKLNSWSGIAAPRPQLPNRKGWTPVPLRTWFWIAYVTVTILVAVGLEVLLYYSNKNQGWPFWKSRSTVLHYVYTLPPVAIAMSLVAAWAWTVFEIKKMQPYVDLVQGDSPAHRSILLDYTNSNQFLVWAAAAKNKHYVVALASLMAILALSFQPLAAGLLTERDTWIMDPDMTVNNEALLGLNQADQFWDLTFFLTAAGYASASVLYNLPDPSFILGGFTVAPFQIMMDTAVNGSVLANTTAVLSNPNCQSPSSMNMTGDGRGGWRNVATFPGCTYSWSVSNTSENLFGVDLCSGSNSSTPDYFSPVVFWFFTYEPTVASSATFCSPTISLWDVSVTVDLDTSNLTSVTPTAQFNSQTSNFAGASGNVTGAPLFGKAYNGIRFNLSDLDPFVFARENATQLALPAAVFQAAVNSPMGVVNAFKDGSFVRLVTSVYTKYLALVAKTVYYLPVEQPMSVGMWTVRTRLWLSDIAVHLLATAMALLAFFATVVQLLHRHERQYLRLAHQPGTIASAVVMGAETGVGSLLSGRQRTEDIVQALRDKKFRIDPMTMKIVMAGEVGYELAATPSRSVFGRGPGKRSSWGDGLRSG